MYPVIPMPFSRCSTASICEANPLPKNDRSREASVAAPGELNTERPSIVNVKLIAG